MVDSAFHPDEVDQMSAKNFRDLVIKSKFSLQGGADAMGQMSLIHRKGL